MGSANEEKRPAMFIGCSTEGLEIAHAIQVNLDRDCESTIWSQGVFGLGDGTLEALVEKMPLFDFGTLVVTPDDLVYSREETKPAPRDNVILELGLCLGALGRKRSFVVFDRTNTSLKLPSDLAGVTLAGYAPHSDGNLRAALGAPCTEIRDQINKYGLRDRESLNVSIDDDTQFQIIHDLMDPANEQLIILMHEENLAIPYRANPYSTGLRYDYSFGENKQGGMGGIDVQKLCKILSESEFFEFSLREGKVSLAKRGNEYAKWLIARGFKAVFYNSDLGGWGVEPADWKGVFRRSEIQE